MPNENEDEVLSLRMPFRRAQSLVRRHKGKATEQTNRCCASSTNDRRTAAQDAPVVPQAVAGAVRLREELLGLVLLRHAQQCRGPRGGPSARVYTWGVGLLPKSFSVSAAPKEGQDGGEGGECHRQSAIVRMPQTDCHKQSATGRVPRLSSEVPEFRRAVAQLGEGSLVGASRTFELGCGDDADLEGPCSAGSAPGSAARGC